jgi:hypothetical protein
MFKEEIEKIQSVFDLKQIEKDCFYLRKEVAPNGTFLCTLSFVKIERTSYGRETLKFEFREETGKVLNKSFVLDGVGVEEAIKFMYSFGVVSSVSYETIRSGLRDFEQIAKLFKYRIAHVEFELYILGRDVVC